MKRLLLPFLLYSAVATVNAQAVNVDTIPKDKFWLFLLIGQSNMVGQGQDMSNAVTTPPRGVYKLSYPADTSVATMQTTYWMKAVDPVHEQPAYLTPYDWVYVGPAMGFALQLTQRMSGIRVGLIPCAINGAELARLQKGGDLYKFEVKRVNRAVQNGILKGILMHQGEDDGRTDVNRASTYATRLSQMIKDLRAELHTDSVPFLIGNLGEWDYAKAAGVYASAANMNTIKQGFVNAVNTNPWTYLVSTAGLTSESDYVHFNASSAKTLGGRYADTLFNHYQRMATVAVAGIRGAQANSIRIETRGGTVHFGGDGASLSEVDLFTAQGRCVARLIPSTSSTDEVVWNRTDSRSAVLFARVLQDDRWTSVRCRF